MYSSLETLGNGIGNDRNGEIVKKQGKETPEAIRNLKFSEIGAKETINQEVQLDSGDSTSLSTNDFSPDSLVELKSIDIRSGVGKFNDEMIYLGLTHFISMLLHDSQAFSYFTNNMLLKETSKSNPKYSCNPQLSSKAPERQPISQFSEDNKLPEYKYVILFINKFFEVYGPFAPFIDKATIESQLISLVQDKGLYSTLDRSRIHETDLIAMLLIVLRLGYLTFYGDPARCDNVTITKNYIEYASRLLLVPVSFNKFSINKIHSLLLLVIYIRNCPEGDETSLSPNIILLAAVQCARNMGLGRGPKSYSKFYLTSKEIYVWHITWIFICYMDANQAFNFGLIPLVNEHELHDFEYKEAAKFCRPSILRILNLMNCSSKLIIPFSSGKIQARIINKREILDLLKEIKEILYGSCRNFEQLCAHSKEAPRFDPKCIERALEMNLRLDLYYKEYSLYFLLYIASEENESFATNAEKYQYFTLSLEKALVLLDLGAQFVNDSKSFLGPELELNVACRLMTSLKMMIPVLAVCMSITQTQKYLLLDGLLGLNCPDSVGLIDWLSNGSDNTDETILQNLIDKITQLSSALEDNFSYFSYSCFKSCLLSKFVLSFARELFPRCFGTELVSSNHDTPWIEGANLDLQLEFWEAQLNIDTLFDHGTFT